MLVQVDADSSEGTLALVLKRVVSSPLRRPRQSVLLLGQRISHCLVTALERLGTERQLELLIADLVGRGVEWDGRPSTAVA